MLILIKFQYIVAKLVAAVIECSWKKGSERSSNVVIFRPARLGDFICATGCIRAVAAIHESVLLVTGYSNANTRQSAPVSAPWTGFVSDVPNLVTIALDLDSINSSRKAIKASRRSEGDIIFIPLSGETPLKLLKKVIYLRLIGLNGRILGLTCIIEKWYQSIVTKRLDNQLRYATEVTRSACGIETPKIWVPLYPEVYVPISGRSRAEGLWDSLFDAREASRRIVICPGGIRAHKRWPLKCYEDLIIETKSLFKANIVILGDENDAKYGKQLSAIPRINAVDLCGKLNIQDTAAVIQSADLFIGNDSGPAHLAAALGIRSIILFSGIHKPGVWEPSGSHVRILRHLTECQGCQNEHDCPLGTYECIHQIQGAEVLVAIREQLGEEETQ